MRSKHGWLRLQSVVWLFLGSVTLLAGCTSPEREKETTKADRHASCVEPENPYSPGTGHLSMKDATSTSNKKPTMKNVSDAIDKHWGALRAT